MTASTVNGLQLPRTVRKNQKMKKESGAKSHTCMLNGPSSKNIVFRFPRYSNKRVANINRNGNLTRAGVASRQRVRVRGGWQACDGCPSIPHLVGSTQSDIFLIGTVPIYSTFLPSSPKPPSLPSFQSKYLYCGTVTRDGFVEKFDEFSVLCVYAKRIKNLSLQN
jgi:hypothetical protein